MLQLTNEEYVEKLNEHYQRVIEEYSLDKLRGTSVQMTQTQSGYDVVDKSGNKLSGPQAPNSSTALSIASARLDKEIKTG